MILVTGANGFLGRALIAALQEKGMAVRGAVRNSAGNRYVAVGDIGPETQWHEALANIDTVIHTAARSEVSNDSNRDLLDEYRRVNVAATINLARQAISARVKRFIFISSIKVNGESTAPGHPFQADDLPSPASPYGVSKLEAEAGLQELVRNSGMDLVIIRPPLIYGPAATANFARLLNWVNSGIPLPLGALKNRRSLVSIDNLIDLIMTCVDHAEAKNNIFLVSDGQDLSTTEMIACIASGLGKSPRLFPIPAWILNGAGRLLGRAALLQRICGSLQVDISKTTATLGWRPPVPAETGLSKAAAAWLKGKLADA